MQIDDLQLLFNQVEDAYDSLLIQEYLLKKDRNYESLAGKLQEFIFFYSHLLGWEAAYSDRKDLFLKFFFGDEYFFMKISLANGQIFLVKKNHDSITNENVLSMLYKLHIFQNIRSEYHCFEIYEMLRNVSLFFAFHFQVSIDLLRVRSEFSLQQKSE